jgi:hypothetical protein
MQYRPGIEAGIMTVVEDDPDCISADWLDALDSDFRFARYEDSFTDAVSRDFGGGRVNPEILGGKAPAAAVAELELELTRTAVQFDRYRNWCGFCHSLQRMYRLRS